MFVGSKYFWSGGNSFGALYDRWDKLNSQVTVANVSILHAGGRVVIVRI